MTNDLEFRVLGTLEATRDGQPVALGGPQQRRLLGLLLLRAGRPVSIDALIDALWSEQPPPTAVKTVHKYVSDLRKKLRDGASIATGPGGYVLEVAPRQVDSGRFERLVDEASRTIESKRAAAMLEEALDLWRGAPWADLGDEVSAGAERARLEERRQAAFEDLMEAELALGRHRQIVGRLEELVTEQPLRERRWGQLMLALYRSDRQAEALATFQRIRSILVDQLGVEPSRELQDLENRILLQDPELAALVASPDVASPASHRPTNLPVQLTSFVGRRRELAQAAKLLTTTRLLTLTGVGGSGKTRLALEVGNAQLEHYSDGVWLAALDATSVPEGVVRVVGTALGAREQPGMTLADVVIDVLRSRRALLILDNCEHLIEACAGLADTLLRACPELGILATSRERLGVGGETVWQVPPMPVPQTEGLPVESLRQHEAIELFVDRARAALPGFELNSDNAEAVAQTCRRVDGIPLALELAASRVASLDVGEIARRLEDRFRVLGQGDRTAPPRQQTLRSALDWSYELLSDDEQTLFNRLSVFAGGFTLDAIEEVCSGEVIDSADAALLLAQLVDKSLVVRAPAAGSPARYQLLETVRQYGREKMLAANDERRVRDRHIRYFLGLAERADPELRGPNQVSWFDRLDAEHDNFGAALEYSHGQEELCLRLATALWQFWMTLHPSEGFEWIETTLVRSSGVEGSVRAHALIAGAWLATEQASTERATALVLEALEIYRSLGDDSGIAASTHLMGWIAEYRGDYEQSAKLLEESAALYERLGETWYVARTMHHLGMVRRLQGDYELAKSLHEKSLAMYQDAGDRMRSGFALWNLGVVARYQGDYPAANAYCEESLQIMKEMRDVSGEAHVRYTLGDIARLQGGQARAVSLYEKSLRGLREVGDKRCVASTLCCLGAVAQTQSEWERAESFFSESLLSRHELGDRPGIAECLERLATVYIARRQPGGAAELFGAAAALREVMGSVRPAAEQADYEQQLAVVRDELGDEAFSTAWATGSADPDEIVARVVAQPFFPQPSTLDVDSHAKNGVDVSHSLS